MRVRFGPAGRPLNYKGPTEGIPRYLRVEEGLDAFEYQAVRGVRIREEAARKLGDEARRYDVALTLHAPYAINLCSSKQATVEASIKRLVESSVAASWMGARLVVFHPGYYGNLSPNEALSRCISALKRVAEELDTLNIKEVLLGPETMGKLSQVGSLEEVVAMCQAVTICRPVIDWAHLYARSQGGLKTKEEFRKVLEYIELNLGSEYIENLHCHYTKVEFGKRGERKHRTLEEEGYGPDFELLAEVIVEGGFSLTIISESPLLDKDAIKMKAILYRIKSSLERSS